MIAAAIGTIIGSIYFVLGDYRLLIAALVCFIVSTLMFTTMSHRRKEMMLLITGILFVFFNYNIRAEKLEYLNIEPSLLKESSFKIINHPKEKFFNDEFIVELESKNILEKLFMQKRFLVKGNSSKGLEKNDIIKLIEPSLDKLSYPQNKIYKKDKVFYQLKSTDIRYLDHQDSIFTNLQKSIKAYYHSSLSKENAEIASSIVLGSRTSNIPRDFISTIRKLGLGHFFAASGFHLLILTLITGWIFSILKLNYKISNSLNILIVFLYAAVTDFSPSIIRAGIFISAYMILSLLDRKPIGLKLLLYLAAIMLFIDPYTIFDLGFQLSYLATLAIIVWYKPIAEKLKGTKIPKYFQDILAISIAVQIVLLPVVIYYFNSLQVWSLIANIVFTPILSLLTLLSFCGLSFIIEPFLNLLKSFVEICSNLPGINQSADINFISLFNLLILTNFTAYILLIKKEQVTQNFAELFKPGTRFDESVTLIFKKLIHNKYTQSSILASVFMLLIAGNLPAQGLEKLVIKKGLINNNKTINDFYKSDKNHIYFDIGKLKILAIKKRGFKEIAKMSKELKPVNLLILKNLTNKDIYFKTLLEKTEPQFVITSLKKETPYIKENLKVISAHANTIVNEGELNIGENRFWWLKASSN